jgi:hypothetical protein
MANAPYASAKFKILAEFEESGVKFRDIISMSASFALNTIPSASLVVAVGNLASALSTEKATIHDAKDKLIPREPVTVTLEIIAGDGATEKVKPGTYTIFKGFFVGIGYQRASNNANYVLNLIHWLDDLNNSSAINGNWFPGAPHDYAQVGTHEMVGNDPAGSGGAVPAVLAGLTTVANMNKDVWNDVIKPLFQRVGSFSAGTKQAIRPPSKDPQDRNDAAAAALDKMPGANNNYVPLALKISTAADANIANSISKYFTSTLNTSFVYNSFWDKLVGEYAAQFLFAISPAVEWALPIPFCGGLRWQDGDPVIAADEYNYANFNSNMNRIIQSVDVYNPDAPLTGGLPTGPTAPVLNYYKICAMWPETIGDQNKRGLKLFKNAAGWLRGTSLDSMNGANGSFDPTAAIDPKANNDKKPDGAVDSDVAEKEKRPILQQFARHWYMTEVLQQRYGELSGVLRFDIAPGSTVKIETPTRDRKEEKTPEHVYASVMSVSYVINSERATAGTSFSIAHTKRDSEKDYMTDKPPLYNNRWGGGPLAVKK